MPTANSPAPSLTTTRDSHREAPALAIASAGSAHHRRLTARSFRRALPPVLTIGMATRRRSASCVRSPLRWRAVPERPSRKQSARLRAPDAPAAALAYEPHDSFELRAATSDASNSAPAPQAKWARPRRIGDVEDVPLPATSRAQRTSTNDWRRSRSRPWLSTASPTAPSASTSHRLVEGPTQVGAEDRCLPGHASNLTDPDPVNEAIEASLETLPLGA